ncbi:MAG TPA: hypothetical protein VLT57_02810 [Bryobacteraceae bacterium]|nr:hypothetical protein [Bryobacteraceae bacterium]
MPKEIQLLRTSEVPMDLLEEIAGVCGDAFAVSYLSGATVRRGILLPWTETAWQRLNANRAAMNVLKVAGIKLEHPAPYGSSGHPASLHRRDAA